MGKGVYHFAMSDIYNVQSKEPVSIGYVMDDYKNGISGFDYERIKASDSLKRGLIKFASFAVENFARACYTEESLKNN